MSWLKPPPSALALAAFVAVAALGIAGLRDRGSNGGAMGTGSPTMDEPEMSPSPELAQATLDRLRLFRTGNAGERLVLDGRELSALLRYGVPGVLPIGVSDPSVELVDDRVRLSMYVATSHLPSARSVGRAVGLLPDTVVVDVFGSIQSFDGRLGLVVARLEVAHVPLPSGLVDELLGAVRMSDLPEPPPATLWLPRADGIGTARVLQGALELLRAEPINDRAVDGSDSIE